MSQFPQILPLPKDTERLQDVDNPIIFSIQPPDGNRPENGVHKSILPNSVAHQNKFAVFYGPNTPSNPLNNPVVGFYPLHKEKLSPEEREGRKDFVGFAEGKNGASVEDLVGLVKVLYSTGPRKVWEIGTKWILPACSELRKMQRRVGLHEILDVIHASQSSVLVNIAKFVKVKRNQKNEAEAIFLVMQWGELSVGGVRYSGSNGFLYQSLLIFVNTVVKYAFNQVVGKNRIHLTSDGEKLAKVKDLLNGALEAFSKAKTGYELKEIEQALTVPIKKSMFDIDPELYDVNVWVPVYPAQALKYLVDEEVLSKGIWDRLKAYLFHQNRDRTVLVDVRLDVSNSNLATLHYKGEKIGESKISNYYTFLVREGDPSIRSRWSIVKAENKIRTVVIPFKNGKGNLILSAERDPKDENIYVTKQPKLHISVDGKTPISLEGKIDENLNIWDAITVADELCLTLRNLEGATVVLCASLDVRLSEKSQVLKQFTNPVYQTHPDSKIENLPVGLQIVRTHRIDLEPDLEAFKRLGLQKPSEYKIGSIQYVFNRGQGDEIAPLNQTYHDFRTEFAKSSCKPTHYHLIDVTK